MKALSILKLCSITLIATWLFSCATNPVTGEKELNLMSESTEIGIGEKEYGPYLQTLNGKWQNAQVSEYLTSVGLQLSRLSHRPNLPYEFSVANASMLNAWALPGGKIAFTRGIMSKFTAESQMVAIMGHEITHVTAKHTANAWTKQILATFALQTGAYLLSRNSRTYQKDAYLYNLAAQFGLQMAFMAYGRSQEQQSDLVGMSYAVKAGYDPKGVVEVHEMFAREFKEKPSFMTELFQTHPQSHTRIKKAKAEIARKYASAAKDNNLIYNTPEFDEIRAIFKKAQPAFDKADKADEAISKGDTHRAIALYKQAIALRPNEALFHANLGQAYMFNKQDDLANKHLHKAVGLYPGFAKANIYMGQLKYYQGNSAESNRYLLKADSLLPGSPLVHMMLGDNYKSLGYRSTAAGYYRSVTKKAGGDLGKQAASQLRSMGYR